MNRTLVRLLQEKTADLRRRQIAWRITGVATRRLGWIADPQGLDPSLLLEKNFPVGSLKATAPRNVRDWLHAAQADVLFEATSLNVQDGQPAIDHLRAALEAGAHAITANKGPVVHAHKELCALADSKGLSFLFESSVMDGVPIFSMFRDSLPAIHLRGFRGILNSTTNVILSGMEEGLSFEQSLKKAQEVGVAETDPMHDIEGWDAAVKVAALVTVLMGEKIALDTIQREGIRGLSGEAVRAARESGHPYKLVCRAQRHGNGIRASVRPEQVPLSDPLAWVAGTSNIVYFETDMFPGLAITEINPGLEATSYGLLADFIRAVSD
ncbi:MAG: homoserine dehydrogenase [Acidobacteriaceae bacterium]|nr:homoserine dehydrogenase [Acidobacteriaceae bacterium]